MKSACMTGAVLLCAAAPGADGPELKQPRELGRVRWGDDLDAALAASKTQSKPVLVLFQEIPGCSTCTGFGDSALSHPLIVEAIESLFLPVAVHNNRPGKDASILSRYREPAWNNPVVRFLRADGKDIIPRKDQVWSARGLSLRIIEALRAAKCLVPAYLELAAEETDDRSLERAVFAMHCFWEGEAKLGALPGVVATRPVFADGAEAVEVTFQPLKLKPKDLSSKAASAGYRAVQPSRVGEAGEGDRKHLLQQTPLRFLPLTPLQRTRMNAELLRAKDPRRWLSPRQEALAAKVAAALERNPGALDGLPAPPDSPHELAPYEQKLAERLLAVTSR